MRDAIGIQVLSWTLLINQLFDFLSIRKSIREFFLKTNNFDSFFFENILKLIINAEIKGTKTNNWWGDGEMAMSVFEIVFYPYSEPPPKQICATSAQTLYSWGTKILTLVTVFLSRVKFSTDFLPINNIFPNIKFYKTNPDSRLKWVSDWS